MFPSPEDIRLKEYEKEMLRGIGIKIKYPRGAIIFSAGDASGRIYLLEKGTVRIYRLTGDGRQITVGTLRSAGELMGLAETLAGEERACFACAVETVELISIKRGEFQNFLLEEPALSIKVAKLLAYRMREAEAAIHEMVSRQVPERLAGTLLKIGRTHGVLTEEGLKINLRLTHEELASMIGASRQTVTTLINNMKQENLIKQEGKELKITDPQKLGRWII